MRVVAWVLFICILGYVGWSLGRVMYTRAQQELSLPMGIQQGTPQEQADLMERVVGQ